MREPVVLELDKYIDDIHKFRLIRKALTAKHSGKIVLFKDGEVVGLYKTPNDAYAASALRFGFGVLMILEELKERPVQGLIN